MPGVGIGRRQGTVDGRHSQILDVRPSPLHTSSCVPRLTEREILGATAGTSQMQTPEIELINGVRVLRISLADLERYRVPVVKRRRGSWRRGWTGWRNHEGKGGGGGGKQLAGVAEGGGGRESGKGGGRGRFGRVRKCKGKAGTPLGKEKPVTGDWAGMPWDALSLIFQKIGPAEVLCSAQAVCRHWWQLAHDPRVWRVVDFTNTEYIGYGYKKSDLRKMSYEAVDRSAGQLEELSIGEFADDSTLVYMCGRTDRLRSLHLWKSKNVSPEVLADAVKYCPGLEELELSFFWVYRTMITYVGQNCPSLRCFRLNSHGHLSPNSYFAANPEFNSDKAIAIANNMPRLQELQLLGNRVTNYGVEVILNCLPLLESLDLRYCWNVEPDDKLAEKLGKIKSLKLPGDSMEGHPYECEMGVAD